jgi:predicted nucleic acid-binding protein
VIVLDTNVLSEALRPSPAQKVMEWMRSEAIGALFTTTITEAELLFGVALLPEGGRRDSLQAAVIRVLEERFVGRILAFNSAAAREYADIAASRRRIGRPISEPDARIAAIARSRGASVATRNVANFAECGLQLINPWA